MNFKWLWKHGKWNICSKNCYALFFNVFSMLTLIPIQFWKLLNFRFWSSSGKLECRHFHHVLQYLRMLYIVGACFLVYWDTEILSISSSHQEQNHVQCSFILQNTLKQFCMVPIWFWFIFLFTVNSRYLEVVETIFYKFKLPEVQIKNMYE